MFIRANDEIRMTNDGTAVIPSEVEESRDELLELFCGILRLRCAPLRMTVLPSFVLRHCFVIRHWDFVIGHVYGILGNKR
jgi:hypothetical protein